MNDKVKALSFSILFHFIFISFFSYFLSSAVSLSNQKYLEIDLSLYDFKEEKGGKGELKEVTTKPLKKNNSLKAISSQKTYYLQNFSKVKPEENRLEKSAVEKEETEKGEVERGLAKLNGLKTGSEESGWGSEKGEEMSKGLSSGTGLKPEELYLHSKLGIISKIVQSHISYPYLARKMGWEGKVIISFLLTKEGKVTNFLVEKTSSYEILDQNAIETVKRCAKLFPLPPADVKIKLPIVYQLN